MWLCPCNESDRMHKSNKLIRANNTAAAISGDDSYEIGTNVIGSTTGCNNKEYKGTDDIDNSVKIRNIKIDIKTLTTEAI